MREIKFRGLTKEGKWVYGSLVQYGFLGESICSIVDKNRDEYLPLAQRLCPVHPETVGQFTSLCDKNGKEIYEGDILEFTVFDFNGIDTQLIGLIKWLPNDYVMAVEYQYSGETNAVDINTLAQDDEREVIGTMAENPELMEIEK